MPQGWRVYRQAVGLSLRGDPVIKLVPQWRSVWRMYSVWVMCLLGGLGALSDWMPLLREYLPGWLYVSMVAAGIAARIIAQFGDDDEGKK